VEIDNMSKHVNKLSGLSDEELAVEAMQLAFNLGVSTSLVYRERRLRRLAEAKKAAALAKAKETGLADIPDRDLADNSIKFLSDCFGVSKHAILTERRRRGIEWNREKLHYRFPPKAVELPTPPRVAAPAALAPAAVPVASGPSRVPSSRRYRRTLTHLSDKELMGGRAKLAAKYGVSIRTVSDERSVRGLQAKRVADKQRKTEAVASPEVPPASPAALDSHHLILDTATFRKVCWLYVLTDIAADLDIFKDKE
jgi:hypothetical protein